MIALALLPLLVLLGLLVGGRARIGPIGACLAALLAALPALWLNQGLGLDAALPELLLRETTLGAFLALQPVAVVAGGLLFHAAVSQGAEAAPRPATAARIFAVTLPLGAFLESVTGFSVGAVFALTALRGMGVGGAVGVALAAQALVLVPWGGLGPGTALGATLAGVAPQELARIAAWPTAAWLLLLAPLLGRLMTAAGAPPDAAEKRAQLAMLALLAGLLLLASHTLPFELAGVLSAGPVAVLALWRADPPRALGPALRLASPYLLLVGCLLAARLVPDPPAWRPFAAYPGVPITHVAVVLVLVSGALMAARGRLGRVAPALRRAGRPALAMLLYVVLGRCLAGGGIAAALGLALTQSLGPGAAYAILPMALLSGIVTGSNVGSNAALLPVQLALGARLGLDPALVAGLHGFAGGAGAGMGAAGLAMLCALLGDGTRPAAVWRLLLPSMAAVLGLGLAALLIWR